MCLFLRVIGDKLGDILQLAVQHRTELIQRFGFDIIVGPQAADGLAVDSAPFPELVGGHVSQRHGFPKPVKSYHIA